MMYADTKKMRDRTREGFEDMADATANASQRAAGAVDDNMRAFADMSSLLSSGVQEFSREWWLIVQNRLSTNLELLNKLLGCRTLADAMSVQVDLAKTNLQQPLEDSRRLMDLSLKLAGGVARHAESNAERATEQARQAA